MSGLFEGKSGQTSMRRTIAFMYAVAGIFSGVYCIFKGAIVWSTLAAAFGIPALVAVVLLLFTTWGDLSDTIRSARGTADSFNKTDDKPKGL